MLISASNFGIHNFGKRALAIRTRNEQGAPAHARPPLRKDVDTTRVLLESGTRVVLEAARHVHTRTRDKQVSAAGALFGIDAVNKTIEADEPGQVGGALLISRLPPPEAVVLAKDNLAYESAEARVDGSEVLLGRVRRTGAGRTGDDARPSLVVVDGLPGDHVVPPEPGLHLRLVDLDDARGPVDEEVSVGVEAAHPGVWEVDDAVAAEFDVGRLGEVDRRPGEREVSGVGGGGQLFVAVEIDR